MALDPVSLAAAATAFLVPFLAKAGEKLPDFAGRVWNAIAARFSGSARSREDGEGLGGEAR